MKHFLIFLLLLVFTSCTVENNDNEVVEPTQDIEQPQDLDLIETTEYNYRGKTYDSTDAIEGLDLDKIDIVYFEEKAFVFDTREESDTFLEKGIIKVIEQDESKSIQTRMNPLLNFVCAHLHIHFNAKGARRSYATLKERGSVTYRFPRNFVNKVSSVRSDRINRRSSSYVINTNGKKPNHTAGAITRQSRIDNLYGSQNDKGNTIKISIFF